MSGNNRISAAISADTKQAIFQKMDELEALLQPVLLFNLTADEKAGMSKMGDRMLSFVSESLAYAGQHPELVPSFLDLAEANKDFMLARDMSEICMKLFTLAHSAEDTLTVSGSEANESALDFYTAVKGASHSNIPGAEGIRNALASHFVHKNKVSKKTSPGA